MKDQIEIIESKGLIYISGDISNHDSKFNVKCSSCDNIFGTTLRTIKNSPLDTMRCKNCHSKKKSEMHRLPFEIITQTLKDNGCTIISDESDYKNHSSKISFIAKCGHFHETTWMGICNTKHFLCKDCQKSTVTGERNYNWKGGTYTSELVAFRKSYEFRKWRRDVFKRDNHTCQYCGDKNRELHAHHIDGYNWCVEKRTDVDNGVTLCKECHIAFHKKYGSGDNTKKQFYEWINHKD